MKGLAALVTGGGSGIGLATAKLLIANGASVMIVGRDMARLKAAQSEIGADQNLLRVMSGDVSSEGYANKLIGEVVKAFGGLNILVNSAGVFRGGSLFDMTEEDFDHNLDVNLKGTWLMCKYGARAMKDAGYGSIVNVSSLSASGSVVGWPSSAYSAAKGGVVSLTKALAVELAVHKIRVNVVLPGIIDTPMLYSLADKSHVESLKQKAGKKYPLGRVGKPEDVAKAICFLADPANDWITGCEMRVDGGVNVAL